MTPLQFCNFLKENLKTNKLVIGKDFKFGKERKGDIKTLLDFFGPENIFLLEDVKLSRLPSKELCITERILTSATFFAS